MTLPRLVRKSRHRSIRSSQSPHRGVFRSTRSQSPSPARTQPAAAIAVLAAPVIVAAIDHQPHRDDRCPQRPGGPIEHRRRYSRDADSRDVRRREFYRVGCGQECYHSGLSRLEPLRVMANRSLSFP